MFAEKDEIFLEDSPEQPTIPDKSTKKPVFAQKTFEIYLTYEQYQFLKSQLPKNYSLKERKKKKKTSFSAIVPSKKLHFERKTPAFPRKPAAFVENPANTTANSLENPATPLDSRDKLTIFDALPEEEYAKIAKLARSLDCADASLRKCYKILLLLRKHPKAGPFAQPVDHVSLKIPDYPLIIKEPMDLGTLETRLLRGNYRDKTEFLRDLRRIWSNSLTYNPKNTSIYAITLEMQEFCEKLVNEAFSVGKYAKESAIFGKIEGIFKGFEGIYKGTRERSRENLNKSQENTGKSKENRKKLFEELRKVKGVEMLGVLQILGERLEEREEVSVDLKEISEEKAGSLRNYLEFIEKNRKLRETEKLKKKKHEEASKKNQVFLMKFIFFH
ncbi:MAG: hypothetical protein H6620_12210 [Halobacteriovoraceae bacterium]|nr:hypothetical protein [Halobacteriovoraceae bacterium]